MKPAGPAPVGSSAGDSQEQRDAERLILDGVERRIRRRLTPRRLVLASGAIVEVDGVTRDRSVLVEAFARQGAPKGGQKRKVAADALKLITFAHEHDAQPRMILAFADERLAAWARGGSWLASALAAWGVEVMVVSLDESVATGLRAAQARQFR